MQDYLFTEAPGEVSRCKHGLKHTSQYCQPTELIPFIFTAFTFNQSELLISNQSELIPSPICTQPPHIKTLVTYSNLYSVYEVIGTVVAHNHSYS